MTKVIFIATLSFLTSFRAAGVPVTPAALEPRRILLDSAVFLPPPVPLHRLDEAMLPAVSGSQSTEALRPPGGTRLSQQPTL